MTGQEISLTFFNGGFTISGKKGEISHSWNEITDIVTYKIDMLTTDEICLDISFSESIFTLTESHPSWEEFITIMQNELPSIDPGWWGKVVHPPFAINESTIYQK
ncbi:MAG TPA: hypothetical protein VHM26_06760 [Chitinophagaceae bacterium]|jgi:hypothetical protein|nr:hypothetical protein [Chitinophagaceae bacterium]